MNTVWQLAVTVGIYRNTYKYILKQRNWVEAKSMEYDSTKYLV